MTAGQRRAISPFGVGLEQTHYALSGRPAALPCCPFSHFPEKELYTFVNDDFGKGGALGSCILRVIETRQGWQRDPPPGAEI